MLGFIFSLRDESIIFLLIFCFLSNLKEWIGQRVGKAAKNQMTKSDIFPFPTFLYIPAETIHFMKPFNLPFENGLKRCLLTIYTWRTFPAAD